MSFWTSFSSNLRPMRRLIAYSVFLGLVTAWRLAGAPTSTSPSSMKATTEGVVRAPSEFSMTFGLPPSMIATQELVVPRSMPMIFAMGGALVQVFVRYGVGRGFCNCYQGGAQDPIVQQVTLLHDRDNGVGFGLGLDCRHRLVAVGVEALAGPGIDLADRDLVEGRFELAQRQLDPAHVVALQGGLEAVHDRKQILGEALDR